MKKKLTISFVFISMISFPVFLPDNKQNSITHPRLHHFNQLDSILTEKQVLEYNMPEVIPDTTVDYKITEIIADTTVDHKILITDPTKLPIQVESGAGEVDSLKKKYFLKEKDKK